MWQRGLLRSMLSLLMPIVFKFASGWNNMRVLIWKP